MRSRAATGRWRRGSRGVSSRDCSTRYSSSLRARRLASRICGGSSTPRRTSSATSCRFSPASRWRRPSGSPCRSCRGAGRRRPRGVCVVESPAPRPASSCCGRLTRLSLATFFRSSSLFVPALFLAAGPISTRSRIATSSRGTRGCRWRGRRAASRWREAGKALATAVVGTILAIHAWQQVVWYQKLTPDTAITRNDRLPQAPGDPRGLCRLLDELQAHVSRAGRDHHRADERSGPVSEIHGVRAVPSGRRAAG